MSNQEEWDVYRDRVTEQLDQRGLTQYWLANQIGITETTMSRYLTGKRVPKANVILATAKALKVTTDYLIGLSDDPYKTASGSRYTPDPERISTPALFENAAEECTEAAQAFLKWARIKRGENPTDKLLGDAVTEVHEEVADVMNMIAVIRDRGLLDMDAIEEMRKRKMDRWKQRLENN